MAHPDQLARAVRPALRARRSSRRGVRHPPGAPALLFGADGGLFVSTDGGATFSSQKNDGLSSYLIYAMTGNPAHADDALIGLQDNGTRFRSGTGGTYNQVFGGDGFGVAWSQAADNVALGSDLYMPTDGSYLRISTFGRGVWEFRF